MIAYLDTEAFDHIYKKIGCTGADIANLRKAIYGRQLSIRLSIHTLEEILLARKISPQTFAAQIKLTLSLASSRTLVKPCAQLLLDDIRSYAAQGAAVRPFLRGDVQNAIAEGIATLIESDGEEMEEDFLAVLDDARQEKHRLIALLERARKTAEAVAKPPTGWANLADYFDAASLPMLEVMAEETGTADACRQRGLSGLLGIKSLRMSLCTAIAPDFEQLSSGAMKSGAIHHSVSAAAVAEAYISDTAVSHSLRQLPIGDLKISSLSEFLKLSST